MAIQAKNIEEIRKRGGKLCGNDDFEIVRSTCCGREYLCNNEVLTLYLDPADLSVCYLDAEGEPLPRCEGCGSTSWAYNAIQEPDEAVRGGPWSWAL